MKLLTNGSPPPPTSKPGLTHTDHPYLSNLHYASNLDHRQLHAHLIKTGLIRHRDAATRLLALSSGDPRHALAVFYHIRRPNLFAWNTIIRSFSRSSAPEIAIALFSDMLLHSPVAPDRRTYPSIFKSYSGLGLAADGAQLHARILKLGLEFDPYIRNTLIHMYASCSGFINSAQILFDREVEFDVVAWNSMVMGLSKAGRVRDARKVFDETPQRTSISWNTMLSGYVRNNKVVEAMELFNQMQKQGIEVSEFTITTLLNASASMGALAQGRWLHDHYITKNKLNNNPIVLTSLIDMYSKSGAIDTALQVFEASPSKSRSLSCYNSMIMGLATNGLPGEAIELFSKLEESSSLKPDNVTFLSVLTACNHSGLVNQAKGYFTLMTEKYKIDPSIKHFTVLIDLLGRAGHIEEAEALIRAMPIAPDNIIWGSLLSSSRSHGSVEMAEVAAKCLVELSPDEAFGYVLMSNAYAGSGRHEEAVRQRVLMGERRIGKEPGCSLIEVDGEVHEFVAGGKLHPQATDVYLLLDRLSLILQEFG